MKNDKEHWDKVYKRTDYRKLGWFEIIPEPSLRLIDTCTLTQESIILNIGAGTTTLIDELLKRGFQRIIVNDISDVALNELKSRTGIAEGRIQWIPDDITNPSILNGIEKVDLWHDRAVLHFFTEQEDRNKYFNLLKDIIKPGGHVIIAAFNLSGATKCSGLPVFRYNETMLCDALGEAFELIDSFNYTYTMPSGDTRKYIYTLFKNQGKR